MITGFFLSIFYVLLSFIVSLLPVINIPADLLTAFTFSWSFVTALSWLLPVNTLLTVLSLAIFFHISVLVWHFSHVILRYLRGR